MGGVTMETVEFLSVPENRAMVRTISQRVLSKIEPDELEVSIGLIDPLIDMAAEGETVTTDTSDEPGSFGGADLMVMVVVPVVVAVVGDLLTELGKLGIEQLKKKLKQEKRTQSTVQVAVGDVEMIVKRVGSSKAKKRTKELTQAVNVVLLDYLEISS